MSAADVFGEVLTDRPVVVYRAAIQVRDLMVGGIPSDPSVIAKWLEARLQVQDAALTELVQDVLRERFADDTPSIDEQIAAVMESGRGPSVNGFKRDQVTGELVYEGRCMKAAIKEWANSAYPGLDWPGKTEVSRGFRKGLMATLAERVFVPHRHIGLGVKEPSRVEERIKHVMTPQGPRSTISRVEVVESPQLEFTVRVHDDFLPPEAWARIWARGEDIGIGSDRGRSDGMFDLIAFDRLVPPKPRGKRKT